MDGSFLYDLVADVVNRPLVSPVIGGVVGAVLGSLCAYQCTQKRARATLLREKAEALIFVLHQIQYRLLIWRMAIERQTGHTPPARAERPLVILPDLHHAYALQRLYFPAVQSHLEGVCSGCVR